MVLPVRAIRSSGIPSLKRLSTLRLGGRATEVAQVIGDDPVVLFGHRPVVASQPALDVAEEDVRGRWPPALRRATALVSPWTITARGAILGKVVVEGLDALSDLVAPGRAPDLEKQVGRRESHLPEEVSDRFGS